MEATEFVVNMLCMGVGGLALFLLGMKNLSEGMQAVAGDRLRKMISAVTDNRIMACGVGTLVTSIVQSSSVTTVMTVGFVSAGLMTLTQAIGVIMGANIGTTMTAWILVLKIGKYGLPTLGVAAFFFLFSKNDRVRYIGMAVMGIGMVFFGLELMKNGLKPMRTMPAFVEWFHRFSPDSYLGMMKCVLAGCILTFIVQSSSATIGITMGLAMNGIIGFETAAALVLGENIGTTITAFLASLGRSTNARRAAYSHIVFNVLGVLWITAIFRLYLKLIVMVIGKDPGTMLVVDGVETFPYIQRGIAFVHSGFNIANAILFLPFLPLLAKLVTKLVPDKTEREVHHLKYLDVRMISSPALGIQESHDEVVRMGGHVTKMMGLLRSILESKESDDNLVRKLFHREEILDTVQREVTEFLGQLLAGNVAKAVVNRARIQLRVADEYESISDYIANILKLYLKKKKNGIKFSDDAWARVLALHTRTENYIELVNKGVKEDLGEVLSKARVQGDAITYETKESRDRYLENMGTEQATPLASLIFTDVLNAYRRVKDHALNIAEAVAGEK